jgi:hypothetical protein
MLLRAYLLSATAVTITAFCDSEAAVKKIPPPSLASLAGAWLGGSDGGLEYFRLELRENGTGHLAVQYLSENPAVAYSITSTSLCGYTVAFSVKPIDADAEPIYLRGEANSYRLSLKVGGTDGNWDRSLLLEHDSAVKERIRAVEDRASKIAKPARPETNKTMEPTR